MKNFCLTFCLFFILGLSNQMSGQDVTSFEDTLHTRSVMVFKGITSGQLNSVKTILADIPEVTDALFLSGVHECIIFDINLNLGNTVTTYYDLAKRLHTAFAMDNIRIKNPDAAQEIIQNSGANLFNVLK